LRVLPVSQFIRSVGSLSFGATIGSLILLIGSPLLTRSYEPHDFGIFNSLLGVAILISTLCAFSLPTAIQMVETQEEASTALWLSLLPGLLLIAPMIWLSSKFVQLTSNENQVNLWFICGSIALVTLAISSVRAFASRSGQFRNISKSGVADSTVQVGAQLSIGLTAYNQFGLGLGYLSAKLFATFYMVLSIRTEIRRPQNILCFGKKWMRRGILLTSTNFLNQLSVTAIAPIIVILFNTSVAGQMSLASRVLAIPTLLIGQAISTVFFPKIAHMIRINQSISQEVQLLATALATISLPVFSFIILLGPNLFALVFGVNWQEAGSIAAILSPWLAVSFISSTISSILVMRVSPGRLLLFGCVESLLRIGSLFIGSMIDNSFIGIALYSLSGFCICCVTIIWTFRLCNISPLIWLKSQLRFNFKYTSVTVFILILMSISSSRFLVIGSIFFCSYYGFSSLRLLVKQLSYR